MKTFIALCLTFTLISAQWSFISSVGNAINSGINQAVSQVSQGVNQAVSQANSGINQAVSQVSQGVNQVASQANSGVNQAVSQANSGLQGVLTDAGNEINSIGNQIQGEWNQIANQVEEGWNSAMKDVVQAEQALQSEIQGAVNSLAKDADQVGSFVANAANEITQNAEMFVKDLMVGIDCGNALSKLVPMFNTFAGLIEGEQSIEGIVSHWNEYDSDIADLVQFCGQDSSEANEIRGFKMDHSEQEIADCAAAILDLAISAARILTIEADPNPLDIKDLLDSILGISEHCVQGVEYAISDANKGQIGGGKPTNEKSNSNQGAFKSAISDVASVLGSSMIWFH